MNILIDKVRIKNFRSLKNVEVNLQPMTLLVGANNSGKTTFLQALNIALGVNKKQLTKDDLFINKNGETEQNEIIIDLRIIPINEEGERLEKFQQPWIGIFGKDAKVDDTGSFFAFRTLVKFKENSDKYETNYYFISNWGNPNPQAGDGLTSSARQFILLYFLDAQRDLEQDAKLRSSYFGRLAVQLEKGYEEDKLKEITDLVKTLNDKTIDGSQVLSHLKEELSKLNQTTNSTGEGVSLSPFPLKIRDLHKGMKVHFQDNGSDTFGMEYHGMGTRSWASILSFGAFIKWEAKDKQDYFPILALEEPEAHLHPNAQRTLYEQLKGIYGQKIISTHSPYVVGQANLEEIRLFKKNDDCVDINQVSLITKEKIEIQKLEEEIISEGKTPNIFKQNQPIIDKLKSEIINKLDKDEVRKIKREVLNTKGELLFSKAIVLFEGKTEEQAIPLFAKEYFGCYPFDIGLNFIGVGGKMSYTPFLKLCNFLKIPWYILSDGDGNTENEVRKQIKGSYGENFENLIVLPESTDFEKHLINEGFEAEIIQAINNVEGDNFFPTKYIEKLNGAEGKGKSIRVYKDENGVVSEDAKRQALIDCMGENKTAFAEEIALSILTKKDENGKIVLPSAIETLFAKINSDFNIINTQENETGTI
jgi:putative ATP-dependent endonuclease of OLD family